MTKSIRTATALYYYDGIQLFDARDAIGGHYLGVFVEDTPGGGCRYLVVGVSPQDLQRLRLGQIDLRAVIEHRAEPDWFMVEGAIDLDGPLTLQAQSGPIPESYLPQAGFLLRSAASSTRVAAVRDEALARRTVVVELTLEPPEAASAHLIRANKLSGLLLHVQSLVKHAYSKSIEALSPAQKSAIDRDEAPLLDVAVPALPGSFRLILVASQTPNLFGGGEIVRALDVVDDITSVSGNPDETLTRVTKYRGHTASAYLRLLRFIVESGVSVRYAWSAPDRRDVSEHAITRVQAEPLVSILAASESLGSEQVILVGQLRKVDVDAGTWRLNVAAENKDYSGKVRPGVSLSHLETDRMYRFVCDEEVEEVLGTGREVRTLYLSAFAVSDQAGTQNTR